MSELALTAIKREVSLVVLLRVMLAAGSNDSFLYTGALRMRLASLVGLALLTAACGPKSDTQTAAAAPASTPAMSEAQLDSVKGVDAAWAAAMNAKDMAAVLAVYADDSKLLPPDSPILDKAGAHAVLAGFIAAGASDFVLTPTVAYGVGDLGYVVGAAKVQNGRRCGDGEVHRRRAQRRRRQVALCGGHVQRSRRADRGGGSDEEIGRG
jgi:ketosteroid isomerase-like protein